MSLGMVSFLAGLGGGYLDGKQKASDDARLAKRDQREDENFAYLQEQRGRQRMVDQKSDKLQADLTTAAAPVRVQTIAADPATRDNRDVGEPGEELRPTYQMGMQRFASEREAAKASAAQNSMSAVARRQSAVLQGAGKTKEAIDLAGLADRLVQEGHVKLIQTNMVRVPTPDQIKAGQTDFDLDGVEAFNAAGGGTIPAGARGRAKLLTLPSGQVVADFEVVDPTGKPIAPSARAIEQVYGMSLAERTKQQEGQFKDGVDAKLDERKVAVSERNAGTMERYYGISGDAKTAAAAKDDVPPPVWDSKADDFLKARYTVKDEAGGATRVDGDGLMFAKELALAQARRNGGDTTTALGFAFDVDEKVRAKAEVMGRELIKKLPKDDRNDPAAQANAMRVAIKTERAEAMKILRQPADSGVDPGPPRTRPMTKMEMVRADMAKNGVKNATVKLDGETTTIGTGATMTERAAHDAPLTAPGVQPDAQEAAGQKLDAARNGLAAAVASLQRYGSRQRQADPQGYANAQAAEQAAQQQVQAATVQYQALVQIPAAAAGRYPRP